MLKKQHISKYVTEVKEAWISCPDGVHARLQYRKTERVSYQQPFY